MRRLYSFSRPHGRTALRHLFTLSLLLILFVAMTPTAQAARTDPADRVAELHEITPTVEDSLSQDEGRWSLTNGVGNRVFFANGSLHLRSRTIK